MYVHQYECNIATVTNNNIFVDSRERVSEQIYQKALITCTYKCTVNE